MNGCKMLYAAISQLAGFLAHSTLGDPGGYSLRAALH